MQPCPWGAVELRVMEAELRTACASYPHECSAYGLIRFFRCWLELAVLLHLQVTNAQGRPLGFREAHLMDARGDTPIAEIQRRCSEQLGLPPNCFAVSVPVREDCFRVSLQRPVSPLPLADDMMLPTFCTRQGSVPSGLLVFGLFCGTDVLWTGTRLPVTVSLSGYSLV